MTICSELNCNNKFYKNDMVTKTEGVPLCKKHYRMYSLNWSEYEATKGKKQVKYKVNIKKIKGILNKIYRNQKKR